MSTNDREYQRRYYEANKERMKEQAKAWYEAHKDDPDFIEKKKAYNKARRQRPEIKALESKRQNERIKAIRQTPEFKAKKRKWSNDAYYRIREANRPLMDEFFGGGCSKCGESDRACLEAHHINPEEKDDNVSLLWKYANQDRIRAELAKCICLCANCHRKEHAK